jgi:purine catabolism regulator
MARLKPRLQEYERRRPSAAFVSSAAPRESFFVPRTPGKEDPIALTVRALLRWPPLAEAEVVAGEAGLDREVSWPAVLRVRAPAFEPLSGHELALVSIEALHLLDESLSLAQLIGRLAERNVAGVVVVGPVDAAALARAEAAGVPLLRLPETYHLSELGPAVSRIIAEQRTRLYQLGLDAHQQLAEVSLAGRGVPGILDRVAELTGRSAVLLDAAGDLRSRALPSSLAYDDALAADANLPPATVLKVRLPPGGRSEPPVGRFELGRGLAQGVPVVVREVVVAFLLLLAPVDDFGDDDQIVLGRASLVLALELAKQEAVSEAERRLRGSFFDDLLENGATAEAADMLINRGRRLGYDLQRTYLALAICPSRPDGNGQSGPEVSPALIEKIAREAGEYLNARRAVGLLASRRQSVALFLAADAADEAGRVPAGSRRFAEDLRDYLAGPVGIAVSVGIGRHHPGVAGLRLAYREAEQASQIGLAFFGPGQVTAYADLGVYRLLYAFRGSSELVQFCDETLAPLTDYDAKNGTALIETLEAYFRSDASLRDAADTLYLHRNSLAYRLRRISEITGLNLDNLEDRFRLQLALKGFRLVRGGEESRIQNPESRRA